MQQDGGDSANTCYKRVYLPPPQKKIFVCIKSRTPGWGGEKAPAAGGGCPMVRDGGITPSVGGGGAWGHGWPWGQWDRCRDLGTAGQTWVPTGRMRGTWGWQDGRGDLGTAGWMWRLVGQMWGTQEWQDRHRDLQDRHGGGPWSAWCWWDGHWALRGTATRTPVGSGYPSEV